MSEKDICDYIEAKTIKESNPAEVYKVKIPHNLDLSKVNIVSIYATDDFIVLKYTIGKAESESAE